MILVGGATRMPAVTDLVKELTGGKEPHKGVNPGEVVAVDAALQVADALVGLCSPQSSLVTDATLSIDGRMLAACCRSAAANRSTSEKGRINLQGVRAVSAAGLLWEWRTALPASEPLKGWDLLARAS